MRKARLAVSMGLMAVALAACPACVLKTIGIRSDPPGATVYLDGLEVGQTPVDNITFDFYGTREIVVDKPGYLCERRMVKIAAPWFCVFPIDIVTELLMPWEIYDRRYYYFPMKPAVRMDKATLLRHADETREIAKARIAAARREAQYRPRKYVVEGAEKPSVFFFFLSPPRSEPTYRGETEPEEGPETEE